MSGDKQSDAPGSLPGGEAQDREGRRDMEAADSPPDEAIQGREPHRKPEAPGSPSGGGAGRAHGALPEGATVFDEEYPGIRNLDPALLLALQQAAKDSGLDFTVSSGWRSQAYQTQLLEQAITTYGSEAEAAKWVAPPTKSLHVTGDAVDLDGSTTNGWLAEHGAAYGLCLAYANEPWHFELRLDAPSQGCPPPYLDSAHDPRLT